MKKNNKYKIISLIVLLVISLTGCIDPETAENKETNSHNTETVEEYFDYNNIPEYSGNPYVEVNNNNPFFKNEDIVSESFEEYGELDSLGRCTAAAACLSIDTMPEKGEERGAIGHIKPSGWFSKKYDCVEGKYVMNRAHCIGWQLCNENDNLLNLISASRYLNIAMLVFENMVADYIKETNNHVMYRATPIFIENELLCRGLLLEGYSVEDSGKGINFCVYFYNVQPGIEFDYLTGESWYTGEFLDVDSAAVVYDALQSNDEIEGEKEIISPMPYEGQEHGYLLDRSSMKFHAESCSNISNVAEHDKEIFEGNKEFLISIGYQPCELCDP